MEEDDSRNRTPRRVNVIIACALMLICVLWVFSGPVQAAAPVRGTVPEGTEPLPPGVTVQTVLSNMNDPVALAFDPTGRLFYTEKDTGNVRLFAGGVLQAAPVITFSVNTCVERGLLGITLDPDFTNNHYIYVYYTSSGGGSCGSTYNKVVRFVENNGVGSSPVEIFTSPQTAGNHNGGNIHFGPDGKLYISVGDNDDSTNAQDVTVKNGKMHRINSDGTIPGDNPVFTQTGALPSMYAMGLRNSFDFTFDPISSRLFASENGPYCDDELNLILPGYNYGWRPSYPCDDANPDPTYNTIRPLWFISESFCCEAPTGITFYTGSIPQWQNELFMATYNTGLLRHFYLDPTRRTVASVNTVQGITVNMDLETGPDGALYYIEGGGYSTGTLKRIVPAPTSPTPTATATPTGTATPTATPASTAELVTHVSWQGRPAQPNALQQLPLTLTLTLAPSVYTYTATTDASGVFTVSVGSLPSGTYTWRIKGPQFLATQGSVVLGSGSVSLDAGTQLSGDVDDSNCVSIPDFSIEKGAFGKTSGDTGYDPRADLNGDGRVNVSDFGLLHNNFGRCGAP